MSFVRRMSNSIHSKLNTLHKSTGRSNVIWTVGVGFCLINVFILHPRFDFLVLNGSSDAKPGTKPNQRADANVISRWVRESPKPLDCWIFLVCIGQYISKVVQKGTVVKHKQWHGQQVS